VTVLWVSDRHDPRRGVISQYDVVGRAGDGGRIADVTFVPLNDDIDEERLGLPHGQVALITGKLGTADLAGVMTTSGRLGGQAEFTTDKFECRADPSARARRAFPRVLERAIPSD